MGNSVKKEDILFDASFIHKSAGRELVLTKDESLISKMADHKNGNNPVEIAIALFKDILPSNVIEKNFVKNVFKDDQYVIDNNYSGYTYKTCVDITVLRKTIMEIVKPCNFINTPSKKVMSC